MLWSMKKLLDKFPFFLNKTSSSNFFKTENIFNNQFKELYNELFKVQNAFQLKKSLWIYKEQSEEYNYTMHFHCNLNLLKSVIVYCEDNILFEANYTLSHESYSYLTETITHEYAIDTNIDNETGLITTEITEDTYTETYNLDDEITLFDYSYDSTSQNIIPDTKYHIKITTFDEYELEKGFPENDSICKDIYDHDKSLDTIGILLNAPRKQYISTTDYKNTEPTYNNKESEDDYHYMDRLIEYAKRLQKEPLPCAEIWKYLGVNAELINREKYLCKMYSVDKRGENWIPTLSWEHKDKMCMSEENIPIFLFTSVNTYNPFLGQNILFKFDIINMYGEIITGNYVIVPYLNDFVFDMDNPVITNVNQVWEVDSTQLESNNKFQFKLFDNIESAMMDLTNNNYHFLSEGIVSDEITITVKGCDDADVVVSNDGDDNNPGSHLLPVATIQQALKICQNNDKSLIYVKTGDYYLNRIEEINKNIQIVNCNNPPTIHGSNLTIFRVNQGFNLFLYNIKLKYQCCNAIADNETYTNDNINNSPVNVAIPRVTCKKDTQLTLDALDTIHTVQESSITGTLYETSSNEPLDNETVELYINDNLKDVVETNHGKFNFKHIIFENAGEYDIVIRYPETENYCNSEIINTITVEKCNTEIILPSNTFTTPAGNELNIPIELVSTPATNINCNLKLYSENNELDINIENNMGIFTFLSDEIGTTEYTLVFPETQQYNSSNITFEIVNVDFKLIIEDISSGHHDILLVDKITSEILDNANEEDIIITMEEDNTYPKLVITEDENNMDTNDEDIILLDKDNLDEYDVFLNNNEED